MLMNAHFVIESMIVFRNQFVNPFLTRENGCMLGNFIKSYGIMKHTVPY
jgi:hypothetical protein